MVVTDSRSSSGKDEAKSQPAGAAWGLDKGKTNNAHSIIAGGQGCKSVFTCTHMHMHTHPFLYEKKYAYKTKIKQKILKTLIIVSLPGSGWKVLHKTACSCQRLIFAVIRLRVCFAYRLEPMQFLALVG